MACRLFVLVVIVETIIDLIVEGELLVRLHRASEESGNPGETGKMPVYLSIFAFAQ